MIGIYCYYNKINGQYYVGQSVNLERRKKEHKIKAFDPNSSEYNSAIHKAFREYGYELFEYKVLEECQVSELNEREIYWIAKLDSYNNGYNCTLGGTIPHFTKFNESFLEKISDVLINSSLTFQEIHEKYDVSVGFVCDFNQGKIWHRDNINYPLRDTKYAQKTIYYCNNCHKQLCQASKTGLCLVCAAKTRRKVDRPTREELKDLIRDIPFTTIGKRYGVNDNTVRKWCDSYNLPRKKKDILAYSNESWALI